MARILVADDDEQICGLVTRILSADGHEVEAVWSGVEALTRLGSARFDLLILDLVMPEKGGVETIMEIRESTPKIPIVVTSGRVAFGDASTTRLVEHYGAIGLLQKPFTSESLRRAVNDGLGVAGT